MEEKRTKIGERGRMGGGGSWQRGKRGMRVQQTNIQTTLITNFKDANPRKYTNTLACRNVKLEFEKCQKSHYNDSSRDTSTQSKYRALKDGTSGCVLNLTIPGRN